jgi:gliding motility-associated-like protein
MDLDGRNVNELIAFSPTTNVTDFAIEQSGDIDPPEIAMGGLTPVDGAVEVPLKPLLQIRFNEPIKLSATGSPRTFPTQIKFFNKINGSWVEDTNLALERDSPDITFSMANPNLVSISLDPQSFQPNTEYYVYIGTDVFADLSDNNFAGLTDSTPLVWNFTTGFDETKFYSARNGDWNDANTWTHDPSHTPPTIPLSVYPGQGFSNASEVVIGGGHTVKLNTDLTIVANLIVKSGATLDAGGPKGYSLQVQGTIQIEGTLINSESLILSGQFDLRSSATTPFTFDRLAMSAFSGPSNLHANVIVLNGLTNPQNLILNGYSVCDATMAPPVVTDATLFTSKTSTSVTLNWTLGGGNAFVVVRKDGAVLEKPELKKAYSANPLFGSPGTDLGSSGNYVVYQNSGTSVNITGLTPSSTYTLDFYSYNTLFGGCYSINNYVSGISLLTCAAGNASPRNAQPAAYCAGSLPSPLKALSVDDPGGSLSIQWFKDPTGGMPLFTGNSFVPSPYPTVTTIYYADIVDITAGGGCSSSVRTPVTLTVNAVPQQYNVTGDNGLFCTGSAVTNTVGLNGSVAGVSYQLYNTVSGSSSGTPVIGTGGALSFPLTGPGNYIVKATSAGCTADMIGSASVREGTAPTGTGIIAGAQSICADSPQSYTVSGITGAQTYKWELSSGASFVNPTITAAASVTFANGGAATLKVTGENTCGSSSPAALLEVQVDKPVVSIMANPSGEILVDDPVEFSYTSSTTIKTRQWDFGDGNSAGGAMETHTYTAIGPYTVKLRATTNKDCPATAELPVKVVPLGLTTDKIKNAVTINNDKANDFLIIENIEKIPNTEVTLLDRWGVEVFAAKNYKNDWDLKKDGNYLPAGNYVCVVKLNDTGKVYSRTVTVIKGK